MSYLKQAAASHRHDLYSDGAVRLRTVVSVLLDGNYGDKAEFPADGITTITAFWVVDATFEHIKYLLFETSYPGWLWNTMVVAFASTFLSLLASGFGAYAIERIRFTGSRSSACSSSLPIWSRPRSCSFRSPSIVFKIGIYDSRLALIFTYPTFLIPFCTCY